jgi:hypothetical protein
METSDSPRHLNEAAISCSHPADWARDSATYKITVKGCLDSSWSEWFDGLIITADCNQGETTLSGSVADQAALHGLLNKVRNLGLTLLWLNRQDAGVETGNRSSGEDQAH